MTKPLILVVDDDEMHSDLIRAILEAHGYRVTTVRAGETVAEARREQPDLILVDMLMAYMGGGDVCTLLRAEPATARIPIVAMSASARLQADGSLPVDDRLRKPFHMADLLAVVARWADPVAALEGAHTA